MFNIDPTSTDVTKELKIRIRLSTFSIKLKLIFKFNLVGKNCLSLNKNYTKDDIYKHICSSFIKKELKVGKWNMYNIYNYLRLDTT